MDILFFIVAFLSSIVGAICGIGGGVVIKPVLDMLQMGEAATITIDSVPHTDVTFSMQRDLIIEAARTHDCVIIGRCSDVIIEDSFKVFICSSLKHRVERLSSIENGGDADPKKLEIQIRSVDKKRKDYYQYYSGNEWGKPKNYDICLNSGALGIERCVELLAELAAEL